MSGVVKLKGQPPRRLEIVECQQFQKYTDRFSLPMGGMDWVHTVTEVASERVVTFEASVKGPTSFILGPIMKRILDRALPPTVEKLVAIAEER